jgi:quinol monooxygenase YgiN
VITSIAEFQLTSAGALGQIERTVEQTRAFEGCLGVSVLRDVADPTRIVLIEQWVSLEADDAYRAWRRAQPAGPAVPSPLAGVPRITRCESV